MALERLTRSEMALTGMWATPTAEEAALLERCVRAEYADFL